MKRDQRTEMGISEMRKILGKINYYDENYNKRSSRYCVFIYNFIREHDCFYQ